MVDLASLVLLMSIFGWKIAVLYVVFGLIIAVVGGALIERFHGEKYVEEYIMNAAFDDKASAAMSQKDRIIYSLEKMKETF